MNERETGSSQAGLTENSKAPMGWLEFSLRMAVATISIGLLVLVPIPPVPSEADAARSFPWIEIVWALAASMAIYWALPGSRGVRVVIATLLGGASLTLLLLGWVYNWQLI